LLVRTLTIGGCPRVLPDANLSVWQAGKAWNRDYPALSAELVSPRLYCWVMTDKCPICGSSNHLREIIYGMPDGPFDESQFVSGGCCLSESDPMATCINCGWEGEFVNSLETLGF